MADKRRFTAYRHSEHVDEKYTKTHIFVRNLKERILGRHILTVKFGKDLRGVRSEGVTGCTLFRQGHCRRLF